MFLLPFQLIIAMCAFLAGIPISRKLFPDKDEGFWQIIGLSLSSIYFATVTVIGILLNNFGINWIVICATMIWIIFGIITVRDYKSSSSLKTVSTFYISLLLMAIVYQLIIFWKFHFPQSGAIGYPIDNFIPFWVNDIIYHLKPPDSFHLYPEWHISDRPVLFSLVETFFFHLFKIMPFSSLPKYPEYLHPLLFYYLLSSILNSFVLISVFWLLKQVFNKKVAILGTAIFLLAPFTLINTYFSWPKYFATFFFISAIYFTMRDEKMIWIGLSLALAYLAHAMYIFFLPGFLIYYMVKIKRHTNREVFLSSIKLLFLFFLFILPWIFWVFVIYKNPSDKFLRFPFAIFYHNPEIMASTSSIIETFLSTHIVTIVWVRVVNAIQSLLPVSLGMVQEGYPSNIEGIYTNILRFYWTTIPGTLFLSTFVFCFYSLAKNFKENRSFYLNFLLLPFILHLLYWGFAINTGHGGEMGRNDAHLFGAILAGLVSIVVLRFSSRFFYLIIGLISTEFIIIMYMNFDLICHYQGLGTFSHQNLILIISLFCYAGVIDYLILKNIPMLGNQRTDSVEVL